MGTTLRSRRISLVKVMEDDFQMFKCLLWQESENTGTCIGNKGREEPDIKRHQAWQQAKQNMGKWSHVGKEEPT